MNQFIKEISDAALASAVEKATVVEWSEGLNAMILVVDGVVMMIGHDVLDKYSAHSHPSPKSWVKEAVELNRKMTDAKASVHNLTMDIERLCASESDFTIS